MKVRFICCSTGNKLKRNDGRAQKSTQGDLCIAVTSGSGEMGCNTTKTKGGLWISEHHGNSDRELVERTGELRTLKVFETFCSLSLPGEQTYSKARDNRVKRDANA
jgi:hypothetical protein